MVTYGRKLHAEKLAKGHINIAYAYCTAGAEPTQSPKSFGKPAAAWQRPGEHEPSGIEVRQIFNIPKLGAIAGSAVTEGVIKRGANVRVLRERKVVHSGKISSLKRLKDDVREVQSGFECGIGVEGFADVKPGDVLEVYELEEIRPSLD